MTKIDLVKVIVRFKPSFIQEQRLYGHGTKQNGDSSRYLLLQKAEDQNPESIGKWECAGGKLNPKETSLKALKRELKKELGWEKGDYDIVRKLPTIRNCDAYLVDAHSNEVNRSSEHSDYRWLKAEDVQKQSLVAYADLLLPYFNNPEKYLS